MLNNLGNDKEVGRVALHIDNEILYSARLTYSSGTSSR